MDNPSEITYIGKTDFRNTMTKFGIKAKDRFRHMYIIGKSGTGKTTLLENMIVQDIYHGNGVAFIDPHGESADKILSYIPTSRINDVIYFFPGDNEFPVAFNPMEISDNASAAERSLITDGLMTVFKKIWPDAFSGRMEYILNNTMLALLEYPEPSLLGINRMLTDKDFRKRVIANIQDPTVRNAWDELMKWDDKRWSEAIAALVNKIGQFTTNPVIRNIIGQEKSTFNFRQAMDERKIIIMNMSKGLIGEQSATLLGALLITKIYLAAMSRENLTPEQKAVMAPMYFYVDEFQNFANDSFANILSEARKYKLALTVANQFIAQMEETIRDAVFGNMGTTITFRVGPLDAEFMERVFAPVFNGEDLQNISFGQIFLTLLIDGMASKPFSAATLAPIQPLEAPQRDLVIESSRNNYARKRADVEEKIMGWFTDQRAMYKKDTASEVTQKAKTYIVPTTPIPAKKDSTKTVSVTPAKKDPVSHLAKVTQSKKPVIEKTKEAETPIVLSSTMNDLLDQLEFSEESTPVVSLEKQTPVLNQNTPLAPITAQKEKILDKPIKDRAAKPETKNVLMEALEKAKALKAAETAAKPPVVEKPIYDQTALHETLQQFKKVEEPVVKKELPKKEQNQDTNPSTKSSTTNTVREVPEDILKKLLE